MFAFLGGAPLGGLLAGWLTARGGTQLAFAVAGTSAVARRRDRRRGHARGPAGGDTKCTSETSLSEGEG